MAVKEKTGFRAPEELALFSYGFAFKTMVAFCWAWALFMVLAFLGYVGAGLLDLGNAMGSGSLDAVGAVDRAGDYILGAYRPQMLASLAAGLVLMLTLQRGALVQLAAAVGCVALHVILVGSAL